MVRSVLIFSVLGCVGCTIDPIGAENFRSGHDANETDAGGLLDASGSDAATDGGDAATSDGSGQFTWRRVTPVSGDPGGRNRAFMTFDSVRGTIQLTGGLFGCSHMEWDGHSWSSIPGLPVCVAPAAYDNARGVLVVVDLLGDVFEWDSLTTNWTHSSTGFHREGSALAFDQAVERVFLFGGGGTNLTSYHDDTYSWDGSSWTHDSSSGPAPRACHAMAYDTLREQTVLFGGYNGSYTSSCRGRPANQGLGDTWTWDGRTSTWTSVTTTVSPSARMSSTMAYDSDRNVVVLFGGYAGGGYQNDTWEWNGAIWRQLPTVSAPSPRCNVAMAYDPLRRRMYLYGGYVNLTPEHNDFWELVPP